MTMFGVIFAFLKFSLWLIVRTVFHGLRNLKWRVTGVSRQLRASKNTNSGLDRYRNKVHVRVIVGRCTLDLISATASQLNFITIHEAFVDPEYVLQDNITLYNVTDTEACFVETDPHVDVLDSDISAWVKIAQFTHAKRLIVMPLECFHLLADTLDDPGRRLLLLASTARCGSTLMTQIFEETGRCVAWAEPEAMNIALSVPENEHGDKIVRSMIKMLCKPPSRPVDLYVIQFKLTFAGMPKFHKLFPDAKKLFMYRDVVDTIRSANKMSTPLHDFVVTLVQYSGYAAAQVIEKVGMPVENIKKSKRLQSRTHFYSLGLASIMKQYLEFTERDLPISAIKYEDVTERPIEACRKIFEHVGLMFDSRAEQAVTAAFGRDSQRNTPFSWENISKNKAEVIDDHKRALIHDVFAAFGLAEVSKKGYVAPGTITHEQF